MVEIEGCPMEQSNGRSRHGSWRVFLKPDAAGLRILTLDGCVYHKNPSLERRISDLVRRGGIRGIVELEILRQIEKAMGGGLNIQCFFDLIVGTRSCLPTLCHLRESMWTDKT